MTAINYWVFLTLLGFVAFMATVLTTMFPNITGFLLSISISVVICGIAMDVKT